MALKTFEAAISETVVSTVFMVNSCLLPVYSGTSCRASRLRGRFSHDSFGQLSRESKEFVKVLSQVSLAGKSLSHLPSCGDGKVDSSGIPCSRAARGEDSRHLMR